VVESCYEDFDTAETFEREYHSAGCRLSEVIYTSKPFSGNINDEMNLDSVCGQMEGEGVA